MNEWMIIFWSVGALLLAGGALAGYRMHWRKGLVYMMIWGSIFAGATLIIETVI